MVQLSLKVVFLPWGSVFFVPLFHVCGLVFVLPVRVFFFFNSMHPLSVCFSVCKSACLSLLWKLFTRQGVEWLQYWRSRVRFFLLYICCSVFFFLFSFGNGHDTDTDTVINIDIDINFDMDTTRAASRFTWRTGQSTSA